MNIYIHIHIYIYTWMVFLIQKKLDEPQKNIAQVGLIFVDLCDPPHCRGTAQGSRRRHLGWFVDVGYQGLPMATIFSDPGCQGIASFFFWDLGFWRPILWRSLKFGRWSHPGSPLFRRGINTVHYQSTNLPATCWWLWTVHLGRQITMLLESMPEFSTTPDACRSPWERRPGLSEWWANRYPPKSTMAGKSTKGRFSWENHRTKWGIFHCRVWLPEGSRLCMSMKHEEWWDSTNGDVTC